MDGVSSQLFKLYEHPWSQNLNAGNVTPKGGSLTISLYGVLVVPT